jgi:acetyl-CoA C-acetyltransferase
MTIADRDAYVVEAVRTPVGKYRGALSAVRADDLAAHVLRTVVSRVGPDPAQIDDVLLGCANQAGEDNRNVARMAVLLAGLPQSVPGATVNRLCGSGLEAVIQAARAIRAGDGDLYLAGGVESMSRAPWVLGKPEEGLPSGPPAAFDTSLGWRFPNRKMEAMFPLEAMGQTAENVARRDGISREDQDAFALDSHRKAVAAQQSGAFDREIVAVEVPAKKGPPTTVAADEGPRADTSLEALARLKPVFDPKGSVTAGNSSPLNDGAACVVVASGARVAREGWKPLARIVSSAVAGVDPRYMGIGPVPATRKVLDRTGLRVSDLDAIELNEAFAAQSLACIRGLDLDPKRVNVNGGAIALGHPLGCSGAKILTTLIYALHRSGGRLGLATMCIGVGQGIAALVERV